MSAKPLLAAPLAAFGTGGHDLARPIVADGSRLLVDGKPFSIRGVSIGDPVLARGGRKPAEDMNRLVREWGCNAVRISVHPGTWRADAAAALAALERDVEAARSAGLYSVIDWHAIGWPGGRRFEPPAQWGLTPDAYDTDLALCHHFWRTVAARFGSRPDVIFELFNEPVRLDESVAPGEDWRELRPFYVDLLERIRPLASNLVLVAGGGWAADLTGVRDAPLDDPALGYSWHVYPGTAGDEPGRLDALLDGLDGARPVVVTEWGFGGSDPHLQGEADGFGRRFVSEMIEGHGLGWIAWCWHPSWQPTLIEADWTTPTAYGRSIQAYALAAGRG